MTPTALRRRTARTPLRAGRGIARSNGRPTAPREVSLDDKYLLEDGRILLTGVQGLVRLRARSAPRRSPARAHHRHDDLRLPGLAVGRLRSGAWAQLAAPRRAPRAPRARPQRGARRHLGLGQPAREPSARRHLRRRARPVVRQGSRARPGGRLAAPRELRGRVAHGRSPRGRGRRPELQVLHHPQRVRATAGLAAHAHLLSRQRAGGGRPGPARVRVLARVGTLGRLQDSHERGRRRGDRRGRTRAGRSRASRPRLRARAVGAPAGASVTRHGTHDAGRSYGPGPRLRTRERREPDRGRPRRLAGHRRRREALSRPDARAAQPRARRTRARARRHPRPQAGHGVAAGARDRP